MTDADAFLTAILANPEDDTPRLVYADFLDEQDDRVPCPGCKGEGRGYAVINPGCDTESYVDDGPCRTCKGSRSVPTGNADRAEFVRVQVELAKHEAIRAASGKSGWRTLKLRTQVEALRARESALLAAHGRAWEEPICDVFGLGYAAHDDNGDSTAFGGWRGTGDYEWLWQRGFIGSVRLPTLAVFIGDRDCPRCQIRGAIRIGPGVCDSCSGLGRVRACPNCEGEGTIESGRYENAREPCPDCGGQYESRDEPGDLGYSPGSGTLPALAPRLARVPGIATVEIGDRVPDEIGDEVCWLRDREGLADNPAVLPDPIFDRLEGGRKEDAGPGWVERFGHEDEWIIYPTAALAIQSLALAGGGLLAGLRLPHPEQPT